MEKLTFKERFLRLTKRHKKRIKKDLLIGIAITLALILILEQIEIHEALRLEQNEDAVLTATFLGDMILARNVNQVGHHKGYDYLFQAIKPTLQQSDYVTGNFNQTIAANQYEPNPNKHFHLTTEIAAVDALKDVNLTTLNIANDHLLDFGEQGLLATLEHIRGSGIEPVGGGEDLRAASKIVYHEVNGLRIATLGFSDLYDYEDIVRPTKPGILPAEPSIYIPLIEKARGNADLVLVHIHWGKEYTSTVSERQNDLAKAIVDSGADLVIGHGQQVVAPVEKYKNSLIFYSLGNITNDLGWSRAKESVLTQYQLLQDGRALITISPLWIREGKPRPMNILRWHNQHRIIRTLSDRLDSQDFRVNQGLFVLELDHSHAIKGVTNHAE